jgi:hypothetical protein
MLIPLGIFSVDVYANARLHSFPPIISAEPAI